MSALAPMSHADPLSEFVAEASARMERGDCACVEVYLSRHPGLAEQPGAVLGLIYAEIALREQLSKEAPNTALLPTLEEYRARFPQHVEAIERRWRLLEVLRTQPLEPVGGDATSDFGPTLPARSHAPAPAEELPFPGLVLLDELGHGAMGDVYKAWQPAMDRFVA